jgi:hypothetical protein
VFFFEKKNQKTFVSSVLLTARVCRTHGHRVFLLLGSIFLTAYAACDPRPWLDDLARVQKTFASSYANFEWAVFTRQVDLAGLFDAARQRIMAARSDRAATAAFDRQHLRAA